MSWKRYQREMVRALHEWELATDSDERRAAEAHFVHAHDQSGAHIERSTRRLRRFQTWVIATNSALAVFALVNGRWLSAIICGIGVVVIVIVRRFPAVLVVGTKRR